MLPITKFLGTYFVLPLGWIISLIDRTDINFCWSPEFNWSPWAYLAVFSRLAFNHATKITVSYRIFGIYDLIEVIAIEILTQWWESNLGSYT